MTFMEDPMTIQDQFSLSQNRVDVCEAAGMSWEVMLLETPRITCI